MFILDAETEIILNYCIKNSFTLSFDSWSTDLKTVVTQLDSQVDIESAQKIKGPKNLIVAH